jgi:hypothetical protein
VNSRHTARNLAVMFVQTESLSEQDLCTTTRSETGGSKHTVDILWLRSRLIIQGDDSSRKHLHLYKVLHTAPHKPLDNNQNTTKTKQPKHDRRVRYYSKFRAAFIRGRKQFSVRYKQRRTANAMPQPARHKHVEQSCLGKGSSCMDNLAVWAAVSGSAVLCGDVWHAYRYITTYYDKIDELAKRQAVVMVLILGVYLFKRL